MDPFQSFTNLFIVSVTTPLAPAQISLRPGTDKLQLVSHLYEGRSFSEQVGVPAVVNCGYWSLCVCGVSERWTSAVFVRILQEKLDQPVSAPPSPRDISMEIDSPENMMRHIRFLKSEVERLKRSLRTTELQRE